MNLPEETFEVDGTRYKTTVHAPSEAMDLAKELYASLAGPGVDILKAMIANREELADDNVEEAFAKLETENLSKQLASALRSLDTEQIREMFSKTVRENDEGQYQELSQSVVFDQAFAGNWGEMIQALVQIVKVNGFVDFLSTTIDADDRTTESTDE